MDALQSPEFLIIALTVASILVTYLLPVVIVAAIFWTNRTTKKLITSLIPQIQADRAELLAQMQCEHEELRSELKMKDRTRRKQ